jgi:uncharacterized protein with HEPN domain
MRILENIEKIWIYTKGIYSGEELFFKNNHLDYNATLHLFIYIGENVDKLSEQTLQEYDYILWQKIKDLLSKVIRCFEDIDPMLVYSIITKELPILKSEIITIIKDRLNAGVFDRDCLISCKGSKYYKNVDISELLNPL